VDLEQKRRYPLLPALLFPVPVKVHAFVDAQFVFVVGQQ